MQIAPQLGAHPGQHLHRIEGLGDIVICAHVQAQHLVSVLALGRQQYDGDVAGLPQLGHGGKSVHHGHHDVHEDEVHVLPGSHGQGLPAVVGGENAVALGLEIDLQRGDNILFIINDQNRVHRGTSCGSNTSIIPLFPPLHKVNSSQRGRGATSGSRCGGWVSTPPS